MLTISATVMLRLVKWRNKRIIYIPSIGSISSLITVITSSMVVSQALPNYPLCDIFCFMNREVVREGLAETSSTEERLEALQEAGFTTNAISKALGVTRQSLRNWRVGNHAARSEQVVQRLDHIRFAMYQLIENCELEPNEATAVMCSVSNTPPYIRPIDTIAEDPLAVFELIRSRAIDSV